MKKIFIASILIAIGAVTFAQAPVMEVLSATKSAKINLVLQNPLLTPTYSWVEPVSSGFIQTDLTTLNSGSVTIIMVNSVVDGNTANIRVTANNGGCLSAPFDITLKVMNTPTFNISAAASGGGVCQGGTGVVNITFNTSVTKFAYWIDTDKSGAMDNGETLQSQAVGASSYALTTGALTTAGNINVNIVSITGTVGAATITSPSTTVATIIVNEKPVIIDIF